MTVPLALLSSWKAGYAYRPHDNTYRDCKDVIVDLTIIKIVEQKTKRILYTDYVLIRSMCFLSVEPAPIRSQKII
ncbi:hypothetical protein SAMN05421730_103328 [Anaerobium acetethylicum]|uniref:Uncharacterized protein n=1 Tax=Anaerobium acetethylicum TaxID=1619234 RepID=A0A1D3TXT1_9FIRM|nr:hypothetical protein SAMN05421730_103328 [Anaerobium acetethylicum]